MNGFDDLILSKIYNITSNNYENESKYNADIEKNIYYCDSDKAVFILPQWRNKAVFHFKPLIKKLKTKYTIVVYELPHKLLSDDIKLTVRLFKKIANDIKSTFNKLQKNGCRHYAIIGNNISCVTAAMVASDKRCKKIVLNLTGNDLAEWLWNPENKIAMSIKNELINKGITLNKLKNYFSVMSYKRNSRNLKKKNILVFLSKNDKIVSYKDGIKLLNLFDKDGIKYKLVTNAFLGHYLSCMKNLIFSKEIVNFLED